MITSSVPNWMEQAGSYRLNFRANRSFGATGTYPFELRITDTVGERAGEGHFKLRREGFYDDKIDRVFDEVVISQIDLAPSAQRGGLGTEIVRLLAKRFPDALFVGESQNDCAIRWHETRLETRFPTRMVRLTRNGEERVEPGAEIDPQELLPVVPSVTRLAEQNISK